MALSLQSQHHSAHLIKVCVFLVARSECARARAWEGDFGPRWQPWWPSWRVPSVLAASKWRPGAGRTSCNRFARAAPPNIFMKVCFRVSRKLLFGALAAVSAQFPACAASECCFQNRCRTPPAGHKFHRMAAEKPPKLPPEFLFGTTKAGSGHFLAGPDGAKRRRRTGNLSET